MGKSGSRIGGPTLSLGEKWGHGRCNADGDDTTSVTDPADRARSAYPEGASPHICYNMLGNVEEWTSTLWGSDPQQSDFTYPYDPDDGPVWSVAFSPDGQQIVSGGADQTVHLWEAATGQVRANRGGRFFSAFSGSQRSQRFRGS